MSQPSPHTPAETTPGLAPALEAPTPGRSAPAFLLRGDIVGRYVVLDKIGTGGMGIVYAAYDPELDRKIALKLLRPGARGRAEIARARLLREAQALARLNHPSVIAVHDVGTFEDQVFVAMEFVDGIDAAKWLQSERRTWREVLPVWRQAAEGLAAAHAAGVRPPRLSSPRTCWSATMPACACSTSGSPARPAPTPPSIATSTRCPRNDSRRARRRCSSPRPVRSWARPRTWPRSSTPARPWTRAPISSRSVSRSYEALYGERPFAGERVPEIAFNVVRGRVREPSREGPTVPAWLRKVVLRGLATDPDQRWPDMRALLAALAADPAARQRRFALIAVAGGVLGAGALMLSSLRPDEAVCRGAERKLEGIWDPTVRAALEQGFAGSTLPFATDALASTTALLDEHAARFVALHTDACEATAIRKEQSQDMLDRQVACLERRLKDVRALTRLLAHADDDAVAQAVTATSSLPSFEPCADRQALLSREPVPSGEQAAALAEVDDQLAAGLQLRLAHYREALQTAEAAVTAARSTADPGTIAQALVLLGRTQLALDDGEAAERSLREAAWTADEGGADLVRAEADKDLVWVVSAMPGRAREAEDLAASTTHTLKRIGGDALVEADLHENLGVAARRRGAIEQAVAEHERALALRREHLPTGDPRIADSLLNLGTALTDAGTYDAADAALGEAEQIVRARYGGRHPRVANALHSRGIVLLRRGDPAGAAALLRQATEIREAALPQGHAVIAGSHHDLGEVFAVAKDWAQARTQFDLAVRLREAGKATHPAHLANSLRGRGLAELELGQIEPARATLERAWLLLEHSQDAAARAEIDFAYARALVASDARTAIALARTARGAYLAIDAQRPGAVGRAAAVQEIEAWLRQHDPDRAPRP